jgi:hypothetical protein
MVLGIWYIATLTFPAIFDVFWLSFIVHLDSFGHFSPQGKLKLGVWLVLYALLPEHPDLVDKVQTNLSNH